MQAYHPDSHLVPDAPPSTLLSRSRVEVSVERCYLWCHRQEFFILSEAYFSLPRAAARLRAGVTSKAASKTTAFSLHSGERGFTQLHDH
jgi:hypothetical protein